MFPLNRCISTRIWYHIQLCVSACPLSATLAIVSAIDTVIRSISIYKAHCLANGVYLIDIVGRYVDYLSEYRSGSWHIDLAFSRVSKDLKE